MEETYYSLHREERLAYQKRYAKKNKKIIALKRKAYLKRNAKRIREYMHKYYLEHKERHAMLARQRRFLKKQQLTKQKKYYKLALGKGSIYRFKVCVPLLEQG